MDLIAGLLDLLGKVLESQRMSAVVGGIVVAVALTQIVKKAPVLPQPTTEKAREARRWFLRIWSTLVGCAVCAFFWLPWATDGWRRFAEPYFIGLICGAGSWLIYDAFDRLAPAAANVKSIVKAKLKRGKA